MTPIAKRPARVLIVHNRYQQRGGEDTVCDTEAAQLEGAGLTVEQMLISNDAIGSQFSAAAVALHPGGMAAVAQEIDARIVRFRPDVVHFHNVFPLVGAKGLRAVLARGVPAVLTLHNYRLLCAGAMLMREGKLCELCVTGSRLHGIGHRCYRNSLPGTAAVTAHATLMRRAIRDHADHIRCIALTRFAQHKFVSGGLPGDSIVLKPNSSEDLGAPDPAMLRKGILYVGRLSPEKGVTTLVEAANLAGVPLTVIGDGPLAPVLARLAGPTVRLAGRLSSVQVRAAMRQTLAVALPSTWFEGFPMTAVEAMEAGCMLLASDMGSLAEIVTSDIGKLIPPSDVADWAAQLADVVEAQSTQYFGIAARRRYDQNFSPAANVAALVDIYQAAMATSHIRTA